MSFARFQARFSAYDVVPPGAQILSGHILQGRICSLRTDASAERILAIYSRSDSHYYYEVADGDIRFAHEEVSVYYADETQGPAETEYGIRGLYGSTPAEPIPMLMDMTVMATNCLMGKDIVWSGGLKKRRAQCSSFLIVVQ